MMNIRLGRYRTIIVAIGLALLATVVLLAINFGSLRSISKLADSEVNLVEIRPALDAAYGEVLLLQGLGEKDASGVDTDAAVSKVKALQKVVDKSATKLAVSGGAEKALGSLKTMQAGIRSLQKTLSSEAQATDFAKHMNTIKTAYDGALQGAGTSISDRSTKLSLVQLGNIGIMVVAFAFILFHFMRNLQAEEEAIGQARQETRQILGTVREGLFLLDKDRNIGSAYSDSLCEIFRRDEFEDLTLDRLLSETVPEKTLDVARDFLELLWGDRVNENLIKDLNPLDEVELNFSDGSGGFDTVYLAFDFNQVRTVDEDGISHILVTVTDITERVTLARELEASQAQSEAQLDLLVSILHVDPSELGAFLNNFDASMKSVNALLKKPARDEANFREKIEAIFREVHTVKGESAALGLASIEAKAHEFEDLLVEMRNKSKLDGNDFLPLAVKLDDLLNQFASVRDMVDRMGEIRMRAAVGTQSQLVQGSLEPLVPQAGLRPSEVESEQTVAFPPQAPKASDATSDEPANKTAAEQAGAVEIESGDSSSLQKKLQSLAATVASDQGKEVRVTFRGFEAMSSDAASILSPVCIQLVRNSIVHGLEANREREEVGKNTVGRVAINYKVDDGRGCLEVKDDGQGLIPDDLRVAAIQKGILDPEAAFDLDDQSAIKLIFEQGFSTRDEADRHAGRGVGMDVVKENVEKVGGRLQINSKPGVGTVFRINIPLSQSLKAA